GPPTPLTLSSNQLRYPPYPLLCDPIGVVRFLHRGIGSCYPTSSSRPNELRTSAETPSLNALDGAVAIMNLAGGKLFDFILSPKFNIELLWVDNHLVHVLSPNIYRNTSEALESFDYITSNGNFSFMEKISVKYAGAAAMYFVSKKLKKKYNITDERAALYEAAETWVDALNGREFLGGSKPNFADLAVFGVLRPIRYLRSGKDMVEHTRIGEWYTRMESVVGEPSRIKA
ncbi:prostaglandin E synthase, partial [Trifolium pratense]